MKKILLSAFMCSVFMFTKGIAQQFNTKYGNGALQSLVNGNANSAFGAFALSSNKGGSYNTGTGAYSLFSNSTGNNNTAVGYEALFWNKAGQNNTSVGMYSALNTTGNDNSVFGYQALFLNKTGTSNCAFGLASLYNDSTGYGNTAFGYKTMQTNKTGFFNTAVGLLADVSLSNLTNATAIGYAAKATRSNQVRIGNGSVTSIGGYAGWTTLPSDGRVKKNIKANVPGLAFINKLKPLTYNLNLDAIDEIMQSRSLGAADGVKEQLSQEELAARKQKEAVVYTGFIAQDVQKAAQELNYDFSGVDAVKNDKDMYGIRYAEFVVPLTKAIQELSMMNDEKDKAIAELTKEVQSIKEQLTLVLQQTNITSSAAGLKQTAIASAVLQQNTPNPFSAATTIKYNIPFAAKSASLSISTTAGQVLKVFNLNNKAKGEITVSGSGLPAGTYYYTLTIDGKPTVTKQMLVIR